MNIQEQYFKGVPDYYPSAYLDGYTPQQIMYAVRNKMIASVFVFRGLPNSSFALRTSFFRPSAVMV